MRLHRVQQSQITTPTGSIPNATDTSVFQTRSGGFASYSVLLLPFAIEKTVKSQGRSQEYRKGVSNSLDSSTFASVFRRVVTIEERSILFLTSLVNGT